MKASSSPPKAPDAKTRDPDAVRAMFDGVARRYDLANHLLSGGIDFWWRRRAVELVARWQPRRVLDVATGTGDLALALMRRMPAAEITGADFSPAMLALAARKGLEKTVVADALDLPFESGSFDCVTVAFGLRNMADWGAALREMATRAGGEWAFTRARFLHSCGGIAADLPVLSASVFAHAGGSRDGKEGCLRLPRRIHREISQRWRYD